MTTYSPTAATKKCPYCAEEILAEAVVCRYCGRDLIEQPNQTTESYEDAPSEPGGGAKALATIGVICGIVGFFVFGIPLGIVAILCGIVAAAQGAKGGTASLILGILDVIVAILILSSWGY